MTFQIALCIHNLEELGAWTPHVWTYAYFSILAKIALIFVFLYGNFI